MHRVARRLVRSRVTVLLIGLAFSFAWSIGSHYTGACMGMPYALGCGSGRGLPLGSDGPACARGRGARERQGRNDRRPKADRRHTNTPWRGGGRRGRLRCDGASSTASGFPPRRSRSSWEPSSASRWEARSGCIGGRSATLAVIWVVVPPLAALRRLREARRRSGPCAGSAAPSCSSGASPRSRWERTTWRSRAARSWALMCLGAQECRRLCAASGSPQASSITGRPLLDRVAFDIVELDRRDRDAPHSSSRRS